MNKSIISKAGVAVLGAVVFSASAGASGFPASPSRVFQGIPQLSAIRQALTDLGREAAGAFSMIPAGAVRSDEITTARFQHTFEGIQVLGSQSLKHIHSGKNAEGANGLVDSIESIDWTHRVAQFNLDTRPAITESEALSIASSEAPGQQFSAKPKLIIIPQWSKNSAQLAYRVEIAGEGEVEGRIVDVDAHTGRVMASVSTHWEIAPVDVYKTTKQCQTLSPIADALGGRAPISVNHKRCQLVIKAGVNEPQADDQAVQAFANSQQVLNYYWSSHKRDSFDGQGAPVVNVVHIGDKWTNAFWDSQNEIMAYGDGDGKKFRNLTLSLDVAGHEMTHGVVSKTADLEYQSESGAMNEGFADFFGETIEGQKDWVMGRELFVDPTEGENGLRNLFDPHKTTYRWKDADGNPIRKSAPAHYSEIFKFDGETCGRQNDNCGVHMNATLLGHTGYLAVKALGREVAEKIFYATLVHYLTATSDFAAFGQGARKACASLYDATTCAQLDQVLVQVGL